MNSIGDYVNIYFLLLLVFLPSCWFKKEAEEKKIIAIQGISEMAIFDAIIKEVDTLVNNIVKRELGICVGKEQLFFIPKKRQRLSLYYVQNILSSNTKLLTKELSSWIVKHKDQLLLHHCSLTPNVAFYGDHNDELVMIIDDPEHELSGLNGSLKAMMAMLQKQYVEKYNEDLYNTASSEKYPFSPHIGIGRLRIGSIMQELNDDEHARDKRDWIKAQIIKEVTSLVDTLLNKGNNKLTFGLITILDVKEQTYLNEYSLH